MRIITGEQLRAGLSTSAAIDALGHAFGREDPSLTAPQRTTLATPAGTLLSMPAAGEEGVGVKLVTLSEFNPQRNLPFIHAVYVLFDSQTQQPEAVIDGTELTAIRTAAVSGLATRHLANPDAARLVLFGAGAQATSHLDAMCAVRPIRDVVVVGRTGSRVDALVDRARARGLEARAGTRDDVAGADLICTCTTSAVSVDQRAKKSENEDLLAKYDRTRKYRSAIGEKAAKTRRRNARAELAAKGTDPAHDAE